MRQAADCSVLRRLPGPSSSPLLSAERMLLAIESLDEGTLDKVFSAADTDHDGRINLRELAYALAKINPDLPLAEAKDSATDFFVLFKADPAR